MRTRRTEFIPFFAASAACATGNGMNCVLLWLRPEAALGYTQRDGCADARVGCKPAQEQTVAGENTLRQDEWQIVIGWLAYFLRWRIFDRMRRFLRPNLRRPLPVFLVPTRGLHG